MRTYVENQEFRFVKGIWLHQKRRQIRFFPPEITFFHHTRGKCSELPSYISIMVTLLYPWSGDAAAAQPQYMQRPPLLPPRGQVRVMDVIRVGKPPVFFKSPAQWFFLDFIVTSFNSKS